MKQKVEDEQKLQSELQHQLTVARKKAMRATREKHMQILGMLPASAIPKHLEKERLQSAVMIQSSWRGFVERRRFVDRRTLITRMRSATVIQRAVCNGCYVGRSNPLYLSPIIPSYHVT